MPAEKAGKYKLFWTARSDFPDRLSRSKCLDGKEIARQFVPGSYTEFTPAHIPLDLTAGDHRVELEYVHWHTTDAARPMAVLFQHLMIDPMDKLPDAPVK